MNKRRVKHYYSSFGAAVSQMEFTSLQAHTVGSVLYEDGVTEQTATRLIDKWNRQRVAQRIDGKYSLTHPSAVL